MSSRDGKYQVNITPNAVANIKEIMMIKPFYHEERHLRTIENSGFPDVIFGEIRGLKPL